MIDLNELKKQATSQQAAIYFEKGRYTCEVKKINYVERSDNDPLYMASLLVKDTYPGSINKVGDVVSWGKKINENNIIEIDNFIRACSSPDGDLNNSLDFGDSESNIRGNLVFVEVIETTWKGKPFYTAKFSRAPQEQPSVQSNENSSWDWKTNTTPWDQNVKPF